VYAIHRLAFVVSLKCVGKCHIEAGVIVVEKNDLNGVNLGLLAVVLLLFLLT
jgi:hypothetical protein